MRTTVSLLICSFVLQVSPLSVLGNDPSLNSSIPDLLSAVPSLDPPDLSEPRDLDVCGECLNSSCEFATARQTCRCDAYCEEYSDCCTGGSGCGASGTIFATTTAECRSVYLNATAMLRPSEGEAFWMLSACPESRPGDSMEDVWVRRNCTSRNLPPVSDLDTGRVYKNEYCAKCNGVENVLTWRYQLACSASLRILANQSDFVLTQEILERECSPCSFVEPQFNWTLLGYSAQPRPCHPHVKSCLEKTELETVTGNMWEQEIYDQVINQCVNGPYSLVITTRIPDSIPFRNQYCTLCNGINPNETELDCYSPPKLQELCIFVAPNTRNVSLAQLPGLPFNLFLDIHRDGQVVVASEVITTTITIACGRGEVYNPTSRSCQATVSINEKDCSGEFITLNVSDYQPQRNNTVLFNGATVEVVEWIQSGNSLIQPVICTNFSQNGTIEVNTTVARFGYPAGYFILTYIGCSMSIIGTALILLTYSLFKELRTLPSKIVMNLAAAILLSNLFILVGGPASFQKEACISVAILLHYFFVAQFVWMSIASFEMARTLHQATKLKAYESQHFKTRILIFYLLIGWGIPLTIVLICITLNFTTDGIILYGVTGDGTQGRCWINDLESLIAALVTPQVLALSFNAILLTYISVLLCKASRSQAKLKTTKQTPYLRIYISIFSVTGLTWVFGFVGLLARQSWAWYLYIILNSTQGFIVFAAFLWTKKVAKLYFSLVPCKDPMMMKAFSTKQTNPLKDESLSKQHSNSAERRLAQDEVS